MYQFELIINDCNTEEEKINDKKSKTVWSIDLDWEKKNLKGK